MSEYVIPILIGILLLYSCIKRVNVYDCFTQGARSSFQLIVGIYPYISAIFIAVYLFRQSGASAMLAQWLSPAVSLLGIDPALIELIILKPLSGNGSLALLEEIYREYGSDSYVSRCASVLMSSSETTFYIVAVYFSSTHIKKLRYTIPVSLFCAFVGALLSCLVCRLI